MEYVRFRHLFSENYDFYANTKEELDAIIGNFLNMKRNFFGKENVSKEMVYMKYTKDENGKIKSWHENIRVTYYVRWTRDIREKETELKQKKHRNITLEDVIEIIKPRNSDPENGFDR